MRKISRSVTLWIAVFAIISTQAQDFTNKGKEFWLAYCYHVGMVTGIPPSMTLYLSSDVTTTYSVEIYGVTILQTGTINAGQVVTLVVPNSYFINDEGLFTNRAVHVISQKPIVVYSYITRSQASAATLCLPTTVLGKEYYSANFTQVSNEPSSNSYFTIVAVEDNTTVEITPSANTKNGWTPPNVYTVTLNRGQIYQVLGTVNSTIGVDLTGSRIRSIANNSGGCKRIAVFSGSGKIRIPGNGCANNSSDNLYQQLYPVASWGKRYLTVPSYNRLNNYYRIIRSSPTTNVYVNGSLINPALFTNNYYQFFNAIPNLIEANEPVAVTQYFTTQNCDGNGNPYDPDMIDLNPVEQNINKVTLVSTNLTAGLGSPQHHMHIIMPAAGTGISSFKLDGNPISYTWNVDPADPNYSYVYLSNVTAGYHTLSSDSGFNALAYGYADAETYGYSAGANVKDIYQFIHISNPYATVNFPAACQNTPFHFSITFPYQPTQIDWHFFGLFLPFQQDTTVYPLPVLDPVLGYDSTWLVNGRQLYRYRLPSNYTIYTPGTYPIQVIAQNPTSDGCGGEQQIDYDLEVFPPPTAQFTFTSSGCLADSVHFFGNPGNLNNRPIIVHSWDFADGGNSSIQNPVHLYSTAGTYNVSYSIITDVGCLSDTAHHLVAISPPPTAMFAVAGSPCVGQTLNFIDQSNAATGSTIGQWHWDFGDGSPVINATNGNPQPHIYANPGIYNATLTVTTTGGCQSLQFLQPVQVGATPVADFSFTGACLPSGFTQFTNLSTVSAGAITQWAWNFGDGGTSALQSPTHNYATTGPFNVVLQVTTNLGCSNTITKVMNTVYAQPTANFNVNALAGCLGGAFNFTDNSTAPNNTVSKWRWDFGDGSLIDTTANPSHNYTTAGTYSVKHWIISTAGCMSDTMTKTINVYALPTANFNFSAPNCLNQSITFTDASVPNSGTVATWNWNFGDAVTAASQNPTHIYTTAANYNVTLQVITNYGCSSAVVTKPVTINVLPVANFGLPQSCLLDPNSQFTDSSVISSGSVAGWSWNFGDPNATAANPNTSTAQNPLHKYTATGPYNVSLIVTSNAGCTATVTKPFFVNGAVPIPAFTVQGATSFCSGGSISLTDNSTVNPGSVIRLEIYWDYTADPTIRTIDASPSAGKIYSHNYPQFTTPASRNVTIRYIAFSGQNCVQYIDQPITLYAIPAVQFNAVAGICEDVPAFQITQAGITNGLTGTGIFSGTGVTSSGNFDPVTAGAGSHVIRYTFTSANGCTDYKEQTINVFALPKVDAGPDRFLLQNGSIVLAATATGTGLTYLWTPNIAINDPNILRPSVSPVADQLYYLRVVTAGGCTASDSVFVKVLKGPVIPNIFSPNGDGIHDKWEIAYLNTYPGCTVDIFNRYGQLIYHSIGYNNPWDGTVNGKPVPTGTYYYIIDPKNGREKMSGYVDVIR